MALLGKVGETCPTAKMGQTLYSLSANQALRNFVNISNEGGTKNVIVIVSVISFSWCALNNNKVIDSSLKRFAMLGKNLMQCVLLVLFKSISLILALEETPVT